MFRIFYILFKKQDDPETKKEELANYLQSDDVFDSENLPEIYPEYIRIVGKKFIQEMKENEDEYDDEDDLKYNIYMLIYDGLRVSNLENNPINLSNNNNSVGGKRKAKKSRKTRKVKKSKKAKKSRKHKGRK